MKTRLKIVAILLLSTSLLISGCLTYTTLIPPTSLVTEEPGPMNVLMNDGTIYKLEYARVLLTELQGHGEKYPIEGPKEYFSGNIPLSDIAIVQTVKPDKAGSLLAYGTIGILALATLNAAGGSGNLSGSAQIHYPPSGSCPFVFSFDGADYRFESETFAGAVCRGMERANLEPLEYLRPVDGEYHLSLANQLQESEHVNEISLMAVDHPPGSRIVPECNGNVHTLRSRIPPSSATSYSGADILSLVSDVDDKMWGSDFQGADMDIARGLRDGIICEFDRPGDSATAKLLLETKNTNLGYFAFEKLFSLEGPNRLTWYHQLNEDMAERKKLVDWIMREGTLQVFLMVEDKWVLQSALPPVGLRAMEERVVVIDLTHCRGDKIKIKLDCATDLWNIDALAIDYSRDEPITITRAELQEAITQNGNDVASLISKPDSSYYRMLPGDYALLTYNEVPPSPGASRTYLLKTQGYYYAWTKSGETDDSELVQKILSEPQYGNRLFMPEWMKIRQQFADIYNRPPTFDPK